MIERLWLNPDGDGGNGAAGTSATGAAAAATTGTATGQTQGEGSHVGLPQQQAQQATPTAQAQGTAQTFTQADVDRIVGERAKRAEASAVGELLKGLGVEKADDLKALVDAARKSESDKLSETEKAQKRIEGLEKAIETAKAEAKAAIEAANEKLLQSQVLVAAQSIGFVDPADAWLYLDRGRIKTDEAGNFGGIEEMLKEVAKAKPHLVKPQANGTLGAVPGPRGAGQKTVADEQDVNEFAAIYGVNPRYVKK